ncbi:MAG: type II toxin-antitoxin system HicA family toxin [Nitrospinae bacterium]|nr:type II toxin-antitoxin system HicA family toxin [Nitrospinota bacterium]MBF0634127.1 type II toxin-antitoxin system HicA family toxin [Nitrospinota bacterium]
MRPITANRLIRILLSQGFVLSRQKGSHQIYKNTYSGVMVAVPLHGKNRPIPIGTLMAIIKQSKIPKEEFD